nr:MAG TPA: hypothetical protein [Caudoviricetes sp.]
MARLIIQIVSVATFLTYFFLLGRVCAKALPATDFDVLL